MIIKGRAIVIAGQPGASNTLAIGTVTSLPAGSPATATITGTSPNQTLNLGIPIGNTGTGTPGPANTLTIGTVTTLPVGSSATANITGAAPNQTLNLGIPVGATGAQGIGLSPSAPASLTVAFGTAYRPADTTKPYRVSVMIDANYAIAVAGTVGDTCELWISATNTVGTTGGTKADTWRGSLTGTLTLVGVGVGMRGSVEALIPAGWYFAVRRTAGTTATIPEAYTQLLT
ncbi:hypothetical protein C7387_2298 [Yokenella regensburgei]|uniref:Phage tail protein n=1 Tax=Yokenella regensburgei TaxID=158877 RepID=A0ABX9S3Z3_9ENTR|nr:hypothetical protein [Yokenella regensburgei]RKR65553.1 hypothetical protein C7387_2298 [Yokenella regensburgei]VFS16053.1 Uncharacterised protein [Yokenella regensburgei]